MNGKKIIEKTEQVKENYISIDITKFDVGTYIIKCNEEIIKFIKQ